MKEFSIIYKLDSNPPEKLRVAFLVMTFFLASAAGDIM